MRVPKDYPAELTKGQSFLVGVDVMLSILEVWNGEEQRHSKDLDCWEFLAREMNSSSVHGVECL